MGLFGGKDWNVIAVIFERKDLYRINGNRAKGFSAKKTRDGAKNHARTIYWAVFDQKRSFIEGGEGAGYNLVPADTLQRLKRELVSNKSVQTILGLLEAGQQPMVAKPLVWGGYPRSETPPSH